MNHVLGVLKMAKTVVATIWWFTLLVMGIALLALTTSFPTTTHHN
jgi:hypothetical protein